MSQLIHITDKKGARIEEKPLDLDEVRAKLAQTNGKTYWRSLEELAEKPGFTEMLKREFPGQAPKDWAPLPRRDFLKLMGASLALAGLSGCAFQPNEKIVPYVKQPESIVPGIPSYYATAMPFMGYALGLLAKSNDGRPTKLEGNPDHPIAGGISPVDPGQKRGDYKRRGATDVWAQASLLSMYDPERSQTIRKSGASSNWDTFTGELAAQVLASRAAQGADFALITETITSPTQLELIGDLKRQLPQLRWVSYEPVNRDNVTAGTRLAFGRDLHPVYHFDRADVIVSLDCDFLLEEPGRVAYGREFIEGRRVRVTEGKADRQKMNRLYAIESTSTITGTQADHRFPVKASQVDGIARALAAGVGVPNVNGQVTQDQAKWIAPIVADMKANLGRVIVVAGSHQPPAVHALAMAITETLNGLAQPSAGNAAPSGGVITYHQPIEGAPVPHDAGLQAVVAEMNAGRIKTALIMGTNPAYTAPADLGFADALKKVPFTAHLGMFDDETGTLCTWHVPEAHYLEQWSDARAIDGTASVVQPLILPLYEACKSSVEVLGALVGNVNASGYDIVRGHWARARGFGGGQPSLAGASVTGELAKNSTAAQTGASGQTSRIVQNGASDAASGALAPAQGNSPGIGRAANNNGGGGVNAPNGIAGGSAAGGPNNGVPQLSNGNARRATNAQVGGGLTNGQTGAAPNAQTGGSGGAMSNRTGLTPPGGSTGAMGAVAPGQIVPPGGAQGQAPQSGNVTTGASGAMGNRGGAVSNGGSGGQAANGVGGAAVIGVAANGTDPLAFDKFWQNVVHGGVVPDSAAPAVPVSLGALNLPAQTPTVSGIEVNFRPDPTIWDGRFRQQRLVAGVSQTRHQDRVGQRGFGFAQHRAPQRLGARSGSETGAQRRRDHRRDFRFGRAAG